MSYANGSEYEGMWKNGKKHGPGKKVNEDGTKYEGNYKNDKPHGLGKYTWE